MGTSALPYGLSDVSLVLELSPAGRIYSMEISKPGPFFPPKQQVIKDGLAGHCGRRMMRAMGLGRATGLGSP